MQKTIKSGRLGAFAMTKEEFLYVYRQEKSGLRRDAEHGHGRPAGGLRRKRNPRHHLRHAEPARRGERIFQNSGQIRLGLRGARQGRQRRLGERGRRRSERLYVCQVSGARGHDQLHRVCQDEQPRPEPARRAERQHPRLLSARHEGDRARHHRRMEQGQRGWQDRLYAEPLALRQGRQRRLLRRLSGCRHGRGQQTRATRRCSSCAARPT